MSSSQELLKTAAQWFMQVRTVDAQSDEYVAWLVWMEADPENRRAFAHIQETWDMTRALAPPPASQARSRRASVFGEPQSPRFAIAAGILLTVLGGLGAAFWLKQPGVGERIATGRGEYHGSSLPDGSRIELGGLTRVAVNFNRMQRLIVAEEGEAFYQVRRDPGRPFVVKAGDVLVRAIGTAFAVRREASIVSITVDEGLVEVDRESETIHSTPIRVSAGERISIDTLKPKAAARAQESKLAGSWKPGTLRFEGESLSVVVATLNRYSDREILLGDPALADLKFSGTIFDDRIPQWLQGVQHLFPIKLREVDGRHVALERAE